MTIALSPPTIDQMKKEAHELKTHQNIGHSKALECVARSYGFRTYAAARVAALQGRAS